MKIGDLKKAITTLPDNMEIVIEISDSYPIGECGYHAQGFIAKKVEVKNTKPMAYSGQQVTIQTRPMKDEEGVLRLIIE